MTPKKTVLFVCEGNTFRSVIAEAIFNNDPPAGWRAASAGVRPQASRSEAAIELLRRIGVRCSTAPPKLATSDLIGTASRVVTFGCAEALPIPGRTPVEDWPLPGGWGKTDAERSGIRDEIRRRVDQLKSELAEP